jgi:hypothetical protein
MIGNFACAPAMLVFNGRPGRSGSGCGISGINPKPVLRDEPGAEMVTAHKVQEEWLV